MSDNDLIRRGDVRLDIADFIKFNKALVDEWAANCIDDIIDELPAAEQPMNDLWKKLGRELNDTRDTAYDLYLQADEGSEVKIRREAEILMLRSICLRMHKLEEEAKHDRH